jgi:peptide/bleomycin uptake transporter
MQYLFRSWPTIVELASVYKRLREFEREIQAGMDADRVTGQSDEGRQG